MMKTKNMKALEKHWADQAKKASQPKGPKTANNKTFGEGRSAAIPVQPAEK